MTEGLPLPASSSTFENSEVNANIDLPSLLQKVLDLESQTDDSSDTPEKKENERNKKKKLREIRKLLADTTVPSDDKLKILASKSVNEVKETARLNVQVILKEKERERLKLEKDHCKFVTVNTCCVFHFRFLVCVFQSAAGGVDLPGKKEQETFPLRSMVCTCLPVVLELQKSNTLRDKLQMLCRELQKQNKQVAEESRQVAEAEQQKRQEMSDKFGETVKDITKRLDEHSAERTKQLEENEDLRNKLKSLLEQFDVQQSHWEKQLHAKDLEVQLAEAKLKQQQEACGALEAKAQHFAQQIEVMKQTEDGLRQQLDTYGTKFQEFQETLTQSNEVFGKMKSDSEKQAKLVRSLTKKLKASESERSELRARQEQATAALIQRHEDYQKLERQKTALEGLCRRLQEQVKTGPTEAEAAAPEPTAGEGLAEPLGPDGPGEAASGGTPLAGEPPSGGAEAADGFPDTPVAEPEGSSEG